MVVEIEHTKHHQLLSLFTAAVLKRDGLLHSTRSDETPAQSRDRHSDVRSGANVRAKEQLGGGSPSSISSHVRNLLANHGQVAAGGFGGEAVHSNEAGVVPPLSYSRRSKSRRR